MPRFSLLPLAAFVTLVALISTPARVARPGTGGVRLVGERTVQRVAPHQSGANSTVVPDDGASRAGRQAGNSVEDRAVGW